MPELVEFWVEVVWLGSRWWPNNGIAAGSPVLNRAVRAFRNAAAVAACKVAAEDAFHCFATGDVSKHKLEHSLKKICKEGAYWGTAAGVYGAMESTVEEMRGRTDWKNAVIGGALAGAVMSAATGAGRNSRRDKVVKDAIAGAAIAAAAEFIGHRIRVDLGVVKSGDASSNKTSEGRSGAELYVWERRRQDVDPWVMGRGVELPLQFRTADPSS
ncbi:hypothetical protein SETIT_3G064900v2 [Setaria italica]|uniref:Uncharacterized protein n=1 Tax=Setaria italica TaxID=4555 RepID=A0A368QCV5_SETIT|nr:outer envelope pore protein 16, chloroplastic-like [Setaria italica]RCV15548.1 hypothetical protein SETIT_3G064900v2 [Setaria italica]